MKSFKLFSIIIAAAFVLFLMLGIASNPAWAQDDKEDIGRGAIYGGAAEVLFGDGLGSAVGGAALGAGVGAATSEGQTGEQARESAKTGALYGAGAGLIFGDGLGGALEGGLYGATAGSIYGGLKD